MPISLNRFERLEKLFDGADHAPAEGAPSRGPRPLRHIMPLNGAALERNWGVLRRHTMLDEQDQACLADPGTMDSIDRYSRNIENCVGTLKLPIGVAGPLRVNGLFAKGDYYVPLATTEAALVASYHRGSRLITAAGGCRAMLCDNAVTRAPAFVFANLSQARTFLQWASGHFADFQAQAATKTRHGELVDMRATVEGNHVYLNFDFYTGEAAGQNMVTLSTDAIVDWIRSNSPVTPRQIFIEANLSGDKKASYLSFLTVRGKKVTVEVFIPDELVRKYLHAPARDVAKMWLMATMGGLMSGCVGAHAHCSNGLAALYLATGQDAACVSESSVGVSRMEMQDDGDLYASLTLPNIIVGSVGGGTRLPSQAVGLKMLQLPERGAAFALAEICAAICLAGELSILGALAADHFAAAHERLARG